MTLDATQSAAILDRFCPLHVQLDSTGHIVHVGPTMRKVRPGLNWIGRRFLESFELRRPRMIESMADLRALSGKKLHLRLRDAPQTDLKGVLMPMGAGAVVDLSFGIEIMHAVRDYNLTSADFAPTDLTVEMLYLVEAKSAAMEESRKLNLRLRGAKIAAEEQAFTDTLTGLKNRRAMDHVLGRLIEARTPFAMMQIDLDYFKSVNDRLGHAAGDMVLQKVAQVFVRETRDNDTVARVGGDEFVVLLLDLVDPQKLDQIARRIIAGLEEPLVFEGQPCRISGSAGTTISDYYAAPQAAQMLADADAALNRSKQNGRGRHTLFDGCTVAERERALQDLTGDEVGQKDVHRRQRRANDSAA